MLNLVSGEYVRRRRLIIDLSGCFTDNGTVKTIRLVAIHHGLVQVFDFEAFE